MGKMKLRALIACGILFFGAMTIAILLANGAVADGVGGLLLAALFGAAFLSISRLRCPGCNKRLAEMHPPGGLMLLWLAKEKCRNCGHSI